MLNSFQHLIAKYFHLYILRSRNKFGMTGAGVILSGVEEVLKTAQEKTTSMSSGRSIILGTSGRLSQQCTKTKKAP